LSREIGTGAGGQPAASVIVLTWNGAAYIEDCLEALLAQQYTDLEVLVVDNGSVDGTPDLQLSVSRHLISQLPTWACRGNVASAAWASSRPAQPGWHMSIPAGAAGNFRIRQVGLAGCNRVSRRHDPTRGRRYVRSAW
jgi:glycosyltransferase involved in cell wall biosynthesis